MPPPKPTEGARQDTPPDRRGYDASPVEQPCTETESESNRSLHLTSKFIGNTRERTTVKEPKRNQESKCRMRDLVSLKTDKVNSTSHSMEKMKGGWSNDSNSKTTHEMQEWPHVPPVTGALAEI